jgi:hypothetical protein
MVPTLFSFIKLAITATLLAQNILASPVPQPSALSDIPSYPTLLPRVQCQDYAVAEGDTCDSIAASWNLTIDEFKLYNPGVNCNYLRTCFLSILFLALEKKQANTS